MALTKIATGAINQIMAVDGTTAVLDAIHNLAFTKTGGVGNTWPGDSSNFRTLLGSSSPVIAQATDNLEAVANEIFTPWASVTWALFHSATLAAEVSGEYGSSSMKITCGADVAGGAQNNLAGTAGQPYTCSCRVKANNAGAVGKLVRTGYDTAYSAPDLALSANWQTLHVTEPSCSGGSPMAYVRFTNGSAGNEMLVSAWQRENLAVQTPFALDSRTGGYCRIANPLTAGGDASFVFVVNGPWAGNDGIAHYIFDAKGAGAGDVFSIYKHTDNKLYFAVGDKSAVTAALTTTTWAANVNHVVIGTVTGGAINVYLAGTAVTQATGATREAALNANAYVGTKIDGTLPANAAVLSAAYGRVLTSGEIAALSAPATWASVIDLPQITVTGLAAGNAARLYDSAGNVHASAVETGGTATLNYTLD